MRELTESVGVCMVIGTALHGIATGNMLPEDVKMYCIDNNPSVVSKLIDRGSRQTMGIVSSAREFVIALSECLKIDK